MSVRFPVHSLSRAAALLALYGLPSVAWAAPYSAAGGTVSFDYRVTFVGVHGTSGDLSAEVDYAPGGLPSASGTVSIRAASLKTGNGLQEDHMRGAMGADKFPNIVFALTGVNSDTMLAEGQTLATTGNGKLTLKGVSRVLSVPLKLTMNAGKIPVATQFKFNPYDYGVSYFGGADSIAINVGFVLSPR